VESRGVDGCVVTLGDGNSYAVRNSHAMGVMQLVQTFPSTHDMPLHVANPPSAVKREKKDRNSPVIQRAND